MKALLVHSGLSTAINEESFNVLTDTKKAADIDSKAHGEILLSLGDEVLR